MTENKQDSLISRTVDRIGGLFSKNGADPTYQVKTIGSGVSFVGAPDFRNVINIGQDSRPDAEELTKNIAIATSAYAFTAIMYRASRIGEPPLMVTEPTDDGEATRDHDLDMLLTYPSPDYDMGELQQLTEIYRLTTGSCLWVKERDTTDRVTKFVPFSGDEFETKAKDGRIYGEFKIQTGSGPKTRGPEDVVFFRDLNPNSWRKGLSRLDVALAHLDLGHQINRTIRNFMKKAMFPGGVISPHHDWHPEEDEWNQFEEAIIAWHSGPANAGDPLIVDGGTTFSRAAIPLKELLPGEILDRIESVVGSVFGIPPVVLGWEVGLKNSPWSQMSEARQMTYEDTIEPRWHDVEKKMDRQILAEEDKREGLRIRFDTTNVRAFQADDLTRAQVAQAMRDEWTRNERRVYTNMDPLPEDDPRGDEIGTSIGGLGGFGGGALGDEEEEGEDVEASLALILRQKGEVSKEDLEWAIFDLSTKAAERSWTREIGKALDQLQARIMRLAEDHLAPRKQDEVDPDSVIEFTLAITSFLKGEGEDLLRDASLPLVTSTGTTGVRRLSAQVGLSFSVLEPGLLEYAAEEADFLASVMGETTGRMIAETVQGGLREGLTVGPLRKKIEEAHAFSRTRAQLVARTETTRAWNGAQRRSLSKWVENEPETTKAMKTWLSSRDGRVRDEHVELDGTTIKLDEIFSNGLQQPGEPNCRCTMSYSVSREGEE